MAVSPISTPVTPLPLAKETIQRLTVPTGSPAPGATPNGDTTITVTGPIYSDVGCNIDKKV